MPIFAMTKTILKSLFKKPATIRYPYEPKPVYKNTRGKVEINISACIFCCICQKKCPTAAILVSKPDKKWSIERLRCITCGYCADVCPKKCLKLDNNQSAVTAKKTTDSFQQ